MTAPGFADADERVSLIFVDSNVLLYALDNSDSSKQSAAWEWRTELWKSHRGRISFQVLGEFYINAVRKLNASVDDARAEVRDLLAWKPVITDAVVLEHGWKIQDHYQLSYWDALIVAAAKVASCRYLLTEDLQVGQKLDGVEIISPFLRDPQSVL